MKSRLRAEKLLAGVRGGSRAAIDPFLGLEIDEQQWRAVNGAGACAERELHRTSTADVLIPLIVRSGNRLVLAAGILDPFGRRSLIGKTILV
jgi:hypothetical protein